MEFRDYLSKNRRGRKHIVKPIVEEKIEPVVEQIIEAAVQKEVDVVETVKEKIPASPVGMVEQIRVERKIQTEIKKESEKTNKRYIGEVAELPTTVGLEDGTLVRKGSTVFIKQDGLWESLIEGNTVTREVVKYGVPGGGCGVAEVKQIVQDQTYTPFETLSSLLSTAPQPGMRSPARNARHCVGCAGVHAVRGRREVGRFAG